MSQKNKDARPLWLDCDPGHDDAMAIILAGYHPDIKLAGISTVSGNQQISKVTENALRVLTYSGLQGIEVYEGISRPILRDVVHSGQIHGESGMDVHTSGNTSAADFDEGAKVTQCKNPEKAILAMRNAVLANSHSTLRIVGTGPLTNLAAFVIVFPELIPKIEIICMGGSVGLGNQSPAAEFNFLADPHAASVVFKSGVKLSMIPLEVTHLALFGPKVDRKMFPKRNKTPFQNFIVGLMTFFAMTYRQVYGFKHPAIHDPCAVFYAIAPQHFEMKHMRVDIETESALCQGRSVCDVYGTSGRPKNCYVGLSMNVKEFWDTMTDAVNKANEKSPLNSEHNKHSV